MPTETGHFDFHRGATPMIAANMRVRAREQGGIARIADRPGARPPYTDRETGMLPARRRKWQQRPNAV